MDGESVGLQNRLISHEEEKEEDVYLAQKQQ